MSRRLTIVMYHYVRDLERSRFPRIKGLSLTRFRRQLEHIQAHYTPITVETLLDALKRPGGELPPNAILLTFDDGYSDHFTNVFPLLEERGIQGCFFPAALPIVEHRVLDVNKIQFILASAPNPGVVLDRAFELVDAFRSQFSLKSRDEYVADLSESHRFDTKEVILLKRLLQRDLPEAVRTQIVRRLFAEYVTEDEAAFASELYMSPDQIRCMVRHGMHVGSHGYAHLWLGHCCPEAQTADIDQSLDFLESLGAPKEWTMCYPYGSFDASLIRSLRDRNCSLGFTVEPRIAELDADDCLTLPRLDTNDLPS